MFGAYAFISVLVLAVVADSVMVRDDSFIIRSGLEDPVSYGNRGLDDLVEDFQKRTKRRDLDPKTCLENFDVQRDKIIRTEESREMGAKYLMELDVGSREECLRLCCETDTCDVFVFEEKSPGSCYLFKCGPPEDFKCKFTRHGNFSSGLLTVSRRVAELEDRARLAKHEQDLASLRKAVATLPSSTAAAAPPQPPTPPTATTTPAPPVTTRASATTPHRCSRFQFECHSSGECIAIYNACDGVPQCADASDEAPELGCPTQRPPLPHQAPTIRYDVAVQEGGEMKMSASEVYSGSGFARPLAPVADSERAWPHRLTQAQPSAHAPQSQPNPYPESASGSHIFNHKGGLQVIEAESNPPQSYIPYDQIQETQWSPHRQWQQPIPIEPMPVNEHPMMYHYPQEPTLWKQPIPMQSMDPSAPVQTHDNMAMQPPVASAPGMVRQVAISNVMPDRDKMWAVPQAPSIEAKLEPPFYTQSKTMPETPLLYTKQQGSMHDGPKKGISRTNKNNDPEITGQEESSNVGQKEREEAEIEKPIPETVTEIEKPKNLSDNKTKKKHLKEEPRQKEKVVIDRKETHHDPDSIEHQQTHHSSDHIQYLVAETDHDGLSDKPPGAILLLTLGVTMTVIMGVMLGCRLKMARRRMRRAGKSPFAHDADYLVNGMYL